MVMNGIIFLGLGGCCCRRVYLSSWRTLLNAEDMMLDGYFAKVSNSRVHLVEFGIDYNRRY